MWHFQLCWSGVGGGARWGRASLCSPEWPRIDHVDHQASSNSQPASASQALVLKACATALAESSYSAELQNESSLKQLPGSTNTDLLCLAPLQEAQSAGQIRRQLCMMGSVDGFLEIISIDTRIYFSWNCLNPVLERSGCLRVQHWAHTWRNKPWFHIQRHRWF